MKRTGTTLKIEPAESALLGQVEGRPMKTCHDEQRVRTESRVTMMHLRAPRMRASGVSRHMRVGPCIQCAAQKIMPSAS